MNYGTLKYQNTDVKLINSDLNKYSTTEEAIGVWTNGKTVYRKVIYFTMGTSEKGKTISTGISNMDWLVAAYGSGLYNGAIFLPIGSTFYNEGGWNSFHITGHGTTIQLQQSANYPMTTGYIILEYTKK